MDLFTQPLVGWRLWKVTDDAFWLRSVFRDYSWPLSVCEARHITYGTVPYPVMAVPKKGAPGEPPHECPNAGGQCGFNAYSSLEVAYGKNPHPSQSWAGVQVFGAVQGFGRVVVHEDGFRCSRARVLCLVDLVPDRFVSTPEGQNQMNPDVWRERVVGAAAHYDVPFLPPDMAMEHVAGLGATVEEYLPDDDHAETE